SQFMTSVKAMRWLDQWIGVPLCLVLTGVRRLTDFQRQKPAPPVRGILFVKLVEQGATVLAGSGVCRALELVGRDNVFFLVFEENRFILDLLGFIPPENVITI